MLMTSLTSLFSLYPKGHRTMRKNTCNIILYTLSLIKEITLIKLVPNTHIPIMHTSIILLF